MIIKEISILFVSKQDDSEVAESELRESKQYHTFVNGGMELVEVDYDDGEDGEFIFRAVFQ
jgi:hypothetical protein